MKCVLLSVDVLIKRNFIIDSHACITFDFILQYGANVAQYSRYRSLCWYFQIHLLENDDCDCRVLQTVSILCWIRI